VGGALSYNNGSIKHGQIYVAGASVYNSVGLKFDQDQHRAGGFPMR